MASTFAGGTSYVQSSDVLNYLKITNPLSTDSTWLDNDIIPMVCQYIDGIAHTTWGTKQMSYQTEAQQLILSVGNYAMYGMYIQGAPIKVPFAPIIPVNTLPEPNTQSLISLQVYNGTDYEEWVGTRTEARNADYWVAKAEGIVYIMGWYWFMGYEPIVDYNYGYNVSGTVNMDGMVWELALLKSSQFFLAGERYNAQVTQGIGGIDMNAQWEWLNKRIIELETYIKGAYTPIAGGFIP